MFLSTRVSPLPPVRCHAHGAGVVFAMGCSRRNSLPRDDDDDEVLRHFNLRGLCAKGWPASAS